MGKRKAYDGAERAPYGGAWKQRSKSAGSSRRKSPGKLAKFPAKKRKVATANRASSKGRRRTKSVGSKSRATKKPGWFKALIKTNPVSKVSSSKYDKLLTSTTGLCTWTTVFKCKSMIDLANALRCIAQTTAPSTSTAQMTARGYLTNYVRKHCWRNNAGTTPCKLEFYLCLPRNDQIVATGQPGTAPQANNNQNAGVIRDAPPLFVQGFTNDTVETISGAGAPVPIVLQYNAPDATPYQSSAWCSAFKVKPLKVKWPDGSYASQGQLLPGQEINYECKAHTKKPMPISYARFCLDSSQAVNLSSVYQCMKITPLILIKKVGILTHSDAFPTTVVGTGFHELDYMTNSHWEYVISNMRTQKATTFDKNAAGDTAVDFGPVFTDPEAGVEVTEEDKAETKAAMDVDRPGSATPLPKPTKKQSIVQQMQALMEEVDSLADTEVIEHSDVGE